MVSVRTFALAVLQFAFYILQFSIFNAFAFAAGDPPVAPTLARFSFLVPPGRMTEFAADYESRLRPILRRHGLAESARQVPSAVDSVFNRLYDLKTPAEWAAKEKAISEDEEWKSVLRDMGGRYGTLTPVGKAKHWYELYQWPAGFREVSVKRTEGRWRTYDVNDGLPNGVVNAMIQDRDGYLWFGTQGGATRFDGKTWKTFTRKDGLPDEDVISIVQDREGRFWFGTRQGGVCRYDGKTFTGITADVKGVQSSSILQDRRGHFWFVTTGKGLRRYDGKTWTTFAQKDGLPADAVRSMIEDREGNLWFGTTGGVSRYDGKIFTTFTTKDGLVDNLVTAILQDREGHLWFAQGINGDVSRFDEKPSSSLRQTQGSGPRFTTFSFGDRSTQNWYVTSMAQDREGNLWFGTAFSGVIRYDGKNFSAFTTKDGLAGDRISSILKDREGQLWFSTMGNGVICYDGGVWTTFTPEKQWFGYSVQDNEGNLWFGNYRYDEKTWKGFFGSEIEEGASVTGGGALGLRDRQGSFWFRGPEEGVSRYDGETCTNFTMADGLAGIAARSILKDRAGNIWVGTESGLSRYDGKRWTSFTTKDGLVDNRVNAWYCLLEDREGNLWIGTYGGVSRYDPSTARPDTAAPLRTSGRRFTNFTTANGLVHNWVRSLFEDREGNIWVGTSGGVSRYDGRVWTSFTVDDGLAAPYVASMAQDRQGRIWFATWGGGVTLYDGKTWSVFTQKDGLASISVLSVLQDREGDLWFGSTDKGAVRYRPPPPSPPPVFLDTVVSDRRYEGVSELEFPSTVGLTVFEFHAISLKTRPEAMTYRYRLKGYDKDWRTTHERRVEYQGIPRGDYTFEVEAVDRDLTYSEKPATVALRVHLPYERIGWLSALGVAIVLIGWQTARVVRRDRRLQEANTALSSANKDLFQVNLQIQQATERKSRFLASMSHELRTPMNAIMGFTNLVLRRSGDALPERQRDNLVKVKQASDHLLNLINDILDLSKVEAGRVEIKPAPFDVKGLISSCCSTVNPLVKPGVALNYEVLDGVGEAHTDEARLRQIVINLLSNALKFTEQGEVHVTCRVLGPLPGLLSQATPLPYTGEGSQFRVSPSPAQREKGPGDEGLSPEPRLLEDKLMEIAVSDTGIGIPSEALGYIFEEFRQVEGSHHQQKGTGLGLAITRKLVELLGGTIGAESEVGKGSTFTARIPMVYQAPAQNGV